MIEKWKFIKDTNNKYMVSNTGKIKSFISNKEMKGTDNGVGYLKVVLNTIYGKKKFYIHRLVGEYFIPNPKNKPYINHIDCNSKNNNVNNLEWCTPQENTNYMIKLGRNKRTKQWLDRLHKSQEKDYKKVKGTNANGDVIVLNRINEAKEYGMTPGTICSCCKKKKNHKTYRGYVWEYVE